jgi:hypothetical protein
MAKNDEPTAFAKAWGITGRTLQTGDVHGSDLYVVMPTPPSASAPAPKPKAIWGFPGNGPE